MKILILTWYHPPGNDVAALRLGKLAEYFRDAGHDVWVLTADRLHPDQSLSTSLAQERVIRTRWLDVRHFLGFSATLAGSLPRRKFLAAINDTYVNLSQIPDGQIGWLPYLKRAGSVLLQREKFDLIYASGPPFTTFLAARWLSRKFSVPWFAEYRDAWSRYLYAPRPAWRQAIDERMENRVTTTASGIVAVSESWADYYAKRFNLPTAAVYNGFDPENVGPEVPRPRAHNQPLSIVHMGALYGGLRDPAVLYDAIKRSGLGPTELQISYYGPKKEEVLTLAKKSAVSNYVALKERVPFCTSLQIQRASDILLLLQSPLDPRNVPAKMFEYLAARRPILGLGLDDGIPARLIRERNAGFYRSDAEALATQLQQWAAEKKSMGMIADLPASTYVGLTRSEQFGRLAEFLTSTCQTRVPLREPLRVPAPAAPAAAVASNSFETLGNATILVFEKGRPVLATDPWLTGTCYFGSWALDHPLSEKQIENVTNADYIWISHGHPDHLHDQSLDMLPAGKRILLPDHYNPEIKTYLEQRGFNVTVLPYRRWFRLSPAVRVMCIDNINQDAFLVTEVDDCLLVNINDSPLCGEAPFLRSLVRSYKKENTYLFALCSIDADMCNLVDNNGSSLAGPPQERKRGAVWSVARRADQLGVGSFCCSSSQHIYVRSDSIWANPYRITWPDMRQYWSRPGVRLIEPFVTVSLPDGKATANHPTHQPDESQLGISTGGDDWQARLSEAEWTEVETFVRQFELIRAHVNFVEFTVGGETRRFDVGARKNWSLRKARGITFIVPKQSLMTTVKSGYLDDLLIGNFMKVRLTNMTLYPRFTPLVAKVGGNAKVFTPAQYRKFMMHYLTRNPFGTLSHLLQIRMDFHVGPGFRAAAELLGIKGPIKYAYRRMLGDPINRPPGE